MAENQTKSGTWLIVLAVAMFIFIGGSAWFNVESTNRFKKCMVEYVKVSGERSPYTTKLRDINKRAVKLNADLYTQVLNPDPTARSLAVVTAQKQFADLEKEQREAEERLNAKPLPTAEDCR